MEDLDQICVSYVEPIFTVSCESGLVQSMNTLNKVSFEMDIPYPQVIASTEYEFEKSRIMFTGHKDWVHNLSDRLKSKGFQLSENIQHGLFVTGFGMISSNYEQKIFEHLSTKNIKISKYIRDAKGLLLVFPENQKEIFVKFSEFLVNSKS